jgi:hypothetical protein
MILFKAFLEPLSGQSPENLAIYAGVKELGYFRLYRSIWGEYKVFNFQVFIFQSRDGAVW